MSAHPPACSHHASALWYPQPHRDTSASAGRSRDKVRVPQAADPTRLWSVSCSVPGLEVLTVALPTKEAGCCMWHEQGALSLYLFSSWVIESKILWRFQTLYAWVHQNCFPEAASRNCVYFQSGFAKGNLIALPLGLCYSSQSITEHTLLPDKQMWPFQSNLPDVLNVWELPERWVGALI